MSEIEVDLDKLGIDALKHAQFGFTHKPLSVNQYLIPAQGRLIMSAAAESFKTRVIRHLWKQKPLQSWECRNRYYSFWIILRDGHINCENMDVDNTVKLILDSFVAAGVVPDDKYCRDARQIYADFTKSGRIPDQVVWCVLIRWGKEIPTPATKKGKIA